MNLVGDIIMYTKEYLTDQLIKMGIEPTDTVAIHTSMKAIGDVDGGADTLLDVFIEYLIDGLFIVPTHTWENVNKESPLFDVNKTKPCIGIVPTIAAFHPRGIRSLNPTHSVAAFGRRAKSYIARELEFETPTHPQGCWGKLYDENAKILLIGVGQDRNTFLHAVDEIIDMPERLTDELIPYQVRLYDGRIVERPMRRHYNPHTNDVSQFFTKFDDAFAYHNAVEIGEFGNAKVQICNARICAKVFKNIMNKSDKDLCVDDLPIPDEFYK